MNTDFPFARLLPPVCSALALGLAGGLAWTCIHASITGTTTPPAPRAFASLAAPDSGESNLHAGPDGTLYLTWSGPGDREGERALRLAQLPPDGNAWGAPQTIVSTPLLMENWADFASLTVGTDGTLWAQWFQRLPDQDRGYNGWIAQSSDRGATWSAPTRLGHEFVSLAPLSGGRVLAVWLESSRVPRGERKPGDPSMRLLSRLLARDGTTLRDWVVDPDVCNCCQTTLANLGEDRVFVAYRGRTPAEIRDHRRAAFDGETWSTPESLHDDGWQIAGCPVNGPAVGAQGRSVAAVWFTAADGKARVQAKRSTDGGATFGPAVAVDLGRPMGRLDLAMLSDASAVITWMEMKAGDNEAGIYARRLFPDGTLSPAMLVAPSTQARASGFPRIATRQDDRIVMSWTHEPGTRQVRVLEFAPPPATLDRAAGSEPRTVLHESTSPDLELCGAALVAHEH